VAPRRLQHCLQSKLHCHGPIGRGVEGSHAEVMALDGVEDYGALAQNFGDSMHLHEALRDVCIHRIPVHVTSRDHFHSGGGIDSVLGRNSDFRQEPRRRWPKK